MTDEFIRRAIKLHAESLPEKVREACRVRAREEHMTLQQQLDMLTVETMKDYREPEFLRERKEPEKPPRREVRDGKAAAAGEAS